MFHFIYRTSFREECMCLKSHIGDKSMAKKWFTLHSTAETSL
jgi:hypothetical protein